MTWLNNLIWVSTLLKPKSESRHADVGHAVGIHHKDPNGLL